MKFCFKKKLDMIKWLKRILLLTVNYGVIMGKTLNLAFILTVSTSFIAFSVLAENNNYKLDKATEENFELKEKLQKDTVAENIPSTIENKEDNEKQNQQPQIIREDIDGGYIEKLLAPDGKIIAEKTIKDGKTIQRILNYYNNNGILSRRVTNDEEKKTFYSEEFYSNGNISAQAMFINENNKIGKERKYDINGKLRQEITWMLPKEELEKPQEQRQTIRYGNVVTYYPDGNKAAVFAVGKPAKNTFYAANGDIIKEIDNSTILTFSSDFASMDCQEQTVSLSMDDLVELYEDEGDISYNKCGLPYREVFLYEVVDDRGFESTKFSYDETGMLRRITPYVNGKKEGTEKKYDASGNLTAEISYKTGKKDGLATGYFPTKEKAFQKEYKAGKVINTLTCYFPTGEIAAEFNYINGLKQGKARIQTPVQKELEFADGKLINNTDKKPERQLTTRLNALEVTDDKCLNTQTKADEILSEISKNMKDIRNIFAIDVAKECQNLAAFKLEGDKYTCYDPENNLRAQYLASAKTNDYFVMQVFAKDGSHKYDIPYLKYQRQGWVKQYDTAGNVIAEIYYDEGHPEDSARSYHANGTIKDVLTQANGADRKVIIRNTADGELMFNISYKDGKRSQAFINRHDKNKDVFVRFYEGNLDNIRETNASKPDNYIEYNFALNEYIVSRDGEPIKGGHICTSEENPPIKQNEIKEDNPLKNAVIPTEEDKKQAKLAAKNIGPIAKPDIENLTDSVTKSSLPAQESQKEQSLSKTERFYYPNGNLRKTVKSKGARTEEVKEYSKSGLLLTETSYNDDSILIEKYFGSGAIRRKTQKSYDDNAVMSFLSREDFYDNGQPRYAIARHPETLLFTEKTFAPDGKLKQEIIQKAPLALVINEYNSEGKIIKQTETLGNNKLTREFDANGKIKSLYFKDEKMPVEMDSNSKELLEENGKIYDKGILKAEMKSDKKQNTLIEYYPAKLLKTEITFYNNGEISVKGYEKDGTLAKFAYLAPDGKLHIQKPVVKTIPNYRERYWIDYNNPNWIENQDKYSVKSINRLYLDTAAHILAELEWKVPEIMQRLYDLY